jgi:Zn-dependent protease with chaperone function
LRGGAAVTVREREFHRSSTGTQPAQAKGMTRSTLAATIAAAAIALDPTAVGTAERVSGYAEFRHGDVLIVDGQRVRSDASTRFRSAPSLDAIALGAEVQITGTRLADGSVLASQVTAKPNGVALFERNVIDASDQLERLWVGRGEMFEQNADGREIPVGRILDRGAEVDRVERILNRLVPPYARGRRVQAHVVDAREWNAAALGNGAVWVYTGLLDEMSDDELAIVLGHELAHYTHEHARRESRRGLWVQLAAAGAAVAAESIDNDLLRTTTAVGALLGLTAVTAGYSRDLEDQADRVGLRYAHEAGYDVRAGTSLWSKFLDKYGEQNRVVNALFGSHSRPSDRIRNIERELARNFAE